MEFPNSEKPATVEIHIKAASWEVEEIIADLEELEGTSGLLESTDALFEYLKGL